MSYDEAKLRMLEQRVETAGWHSAALSAGLAELRDEIGTYRAYVQNHRGWRAGDQRKAWPFAQLLELPTEEFAALGLDRLTLRRAVTAEQRLADLQAQLRTHIEKTTPLRTLVKRLRAWAGPDEGYAVGVTRATLGVSANTGSPAA